MTAAATRRLGATLLALAIGLGVSFVGLAVVGFQGLAEYPTLIRRLSETHSENSYSLSGVAAALGFGSHVGKLLAVVVGATLFAACVQLARRGDDQRAFICSIGAALALTPIAWLHYLAFLLVPLAVARPHFSALWLLPIVVWFSPTSRHGTRLEPMLPAFVAAVLLAATLIGPRVRGAVAEAPA